MSDATASPPSAPQPPPPGPGPARKGMSPIALILLIVGLVGVVGLAGCFVVGMWVFQAGQEAVEEATGSEDGLGGFIEDLRNNPARVGAEAIVRMNPDLELLSTDESAGTITFRNNRTGEEATLNFEDIAEGRFSLTTAEGEYSVEASAAGTEDGGVTLSGPDGRTRFGGAAGLEDVPDWVPVYPNATATQSAYQTTSSDTVSGAVSGQTTESAQTVVEHYETTLEAAGYTIGSRSLTESSNGAMGAVTATLEAEGRTINVAAIEQDGETQVLVNYSGRP